MLIALLFFNVFPRFLVPAWFDPSIDQIKFSRIESGTLIVTVENLEINDDQMIFDIEIINKSQIPVYFDADSIYYIDSSPSGMISRDPVRNYPSEEHLQTEVSMRKMKSARTAGTLLDLFSIGLVIFDAASDMRDMHGEWTPKRARASAARDMITMGGIGVAGLARDHLRYTAWREEENIRALESESLISGPIAPQNVRRGKLHFDNRSSGHLRLVVPLPDGDYIFDFREATPEDYRKITGMSE
jgi:hypothetical protein